MFIPKEEMLMVVELPGERTRATVEKVIDDNTIIVQLTSMPMAKSHQYRMDQYVRCHRDTNGLQEIWKASGLEKPVLKVVPPELPPMPAPKKAKTKGKPEQRRKAGR
jgi:hypothetical protein